MLGYVLNVRQTYILQPPLFWIQRILLGIPILLGKLGIPTKNSKLNFQSITLLSLYYSMRCEKVKIVLYTATI